jgi:beta-glucosidase
VAGDEVVEAYLKTPQVDGPLRSLVGFERVHLGPGESRVVPLEISARSLSSVDAQGDRSVLPGSYSLAVGGAQPQEAAAAKSETTFAVTGSVKLPK